MRVNCIVVVVEDSFVEGEVSGLDSRADRMESGGEIRERCLLLNIAGWHHDPQPRAWAGYQTLCRKIKAVASTRSIAGSEIFFRETDGGFVLKFRLVVLRERRM